jgi:glycosyltransferase involved in cell wall biosynthesis
MALAVQSRTSGDPRDTTAATLPRWYLFEDEFDRKYDEATVDSSDAGGVNRVLPRWVRLAKEVHRRRSEYDVVVSWTERVTLSLMTLQHYFPSDKPHIAMLYWFSRPSVQLPLRAFGNSLRAIITWTSAQRNYAIERIGIPAEKIYLIKHYVDQLFWSPRGTEEDMICSAGSEMRDYGTLLEALRGTDVRCHIASDHVRVDRLGFARRVSASRFVAKAPANVTIGRRPPVELRDLYARSRFVVVPLRPSDTDNGVNVILEAMAMGKAVICSRTRGQVDVVQEGVTGLFVPVGDAKALRSAVLELWNNPERAREMGRAARAYVEKHHTLDKFCRDVKGAVDACLDGRMAARDGSFSAASEDGGGIKAAV